MFRAFVTLTFAAYLVCAISPAQECLRAGGTSETCLRATTDPVAESVVKSFKEAFGADPAAIYLAPGRVNLVGT
jgi:hypothetical protein